MISLLCWSCSRSTLELIAERKKYDGFGLQPFLSLDKLLKAFDLLPSHMSNATDIVVMLADVEIDNASLGLNTRIKLLAPACK